MVLVDLKLFKNSIPFVYERKIGVCSRFFTIDLSDDSKWKITPWWTILETKNVIRWFYLHVVVCRSKEKALKSVRGRILFEIFHAFGEQWKSYFFSWRHQAPFAGECVDSWEGCFTLFLIRETCFLWPSFYRRKEDNVVSHAIVFSLPKRNFKRSSPPNWNEQRSLRLPFLPWCQQIRKDG